MFSVPECPLDNLSLDIVGPIHSYQRKRKTVATVVDCLSRQLWTRMALTHPSSISLFQFIELKRIEKFENIVANFYQQRK
jgi:hypothetical protein